MKAEKIVKTIIGILCAVNAVYALLFVFAGIRALSESGAAYASGMTEAISRAAHAGAFLIILLFVFLVVLFILECRRGYRLK